ncbi:hypothetical protein CBM2637_A30032 [Cupriavidus taiwanensis]|nr:hypothetical protein CBM2637_A30032 [Cupriavidus taiwanensis]
MVHRRARYLHVPTVVPPYIAFRALKKRDGLRYQPSRDEVPKSSGTLFREWKIVPKPIFQCIREDQYVLRRLQIALNAARKVVSTRASGQVFTTPI